MSNIVYMCPVTKKGYNNPLQPRLNFLQNQWELSPDQIFEYLDLKNIIEHMQEKAPENDPPEAA